MLNVDFSRLNVHIAFGILNKKAVLSQKLPRDARDHTIRQYTHGLLLESPFVPSSTDCWAPRAKISQKGRFGGHRGETRS